MTEEIKSKMGEGQSHQAEVESVSEELKKQQTTLSSQQEQVVKLKIELAKEEKKWGEYSSKLYMGKRSLHCGVIEDFFPPASLKN